MKVVTATDRPSSCPTSLVPGWFRSAHHQTPLCAFENETVSKLLHHVAIVWRRKKGRTDCDNQFPSTRDYPLCGGAKKDCQLGNLVPKELFTDLLGTVSLLTVLTDDIKKQRTSCTIGRKTPRPQIALGLHRQVFSTVALQRELID